MKLLRHVIILLLLCCCRNIYAQNNELMLAQQYSANGELQKANDIYQKLYKQQNDVYYPYLVNNLISMKKFDEAESITKKMIRRYPEETEYVLKLGSIYTQQGNAEEANKLYDDMLKKVPADNAAITALGMQFYQNGNMDHAIKVFKQGRKMLNSDALFTHELIALYRFKRDKTALTEEYLNFLPENPVYITQAQSTLASLYEGEADYAILRAALYKRLQKQPNSAVFTDMLIWQFMQQKEYDQALTQAIALDRRANSDGNSIFELCRTLADNQAYDAAIKGYEYLLTKGLQNQLYIPAKVELINTKNLKVTSGKYVMADVLGLEQDYLSLLKEFGRSRRTVFAMQRLANLQAFKLHKLNEAQKMLEQAVAVPDIEPHMKAACKLDLGDIYLINGEPWEATLLYSQVEKDFPNSEMEQDAKLRNAKMAYYTGDFAWAKGQLGVLKAATSKLIANDALNLQLLISDNTAADSAGNALKMYARADLQIFAGQTDKALKVLDSIDKKFPGNTLVDDILMARARIFISQKDYAGAVTALKAIAEQHNADLWADDAVFTLGDIYENNLNDKEQAKTYYQKIITDYPGSLWINEARKRFRALRGDAAGV